MSNIKIQKAQPWEAESILRINIAAYNSDKRQFGGGGDGGPPGYDSLEHIQKSINSFPAYSIYLEKDLIGWFFLEDIDENTIELNSFSIDPAHHNKGYGFTALGLMDSLVPKGKAFILGTPHFSVRNQYLYEKAGFQRVGISDDGFLIQYKKQM